MESTYIEKNLAKIKETISIAQKSPNAAADVTLLLATKGADADIINYLSQKHGMIHIGENRVQQLLEKYDKLDKENLSIHFIGKLQRNKVKYIVDKVSMIHSLDSVALAQEIDKRAAMARRVMDVLVEINIGREANKGGIMPEEVDDFMDNIATYQHIREMRFK